MSRSGANERLLEQENNRLSDQLARKISSLKQISIEMKVLNQNFSYCPNLNDVSIFRLFISIYTCMSHFSICQQNRPVKNFQYFKFRKTSTAICAISTIWVVIQAVWQIAYCREHRKDSKRCLIQGTVLFKYRFLLDMKRIA